VDPDLEAQAQPHAEASAAAAASFMSALRLESHNLVVENMDEGMGVYKKQYELELTGILHQRESTGRPDRESYTATKRRAELTLGQS
jgi:hypothetical protein